MTLCFARTGLACLWGFSRFFGDSGLSPAEEARDIPWEAAGLHMSYFLRKNRNGARNNPCVASARSLQRVLVR